jgi:hydrogenase maturation protease
MKILILGIGQTLRGDDSAGLEVVKLWQSRHPDCDIQVHVDLSELPGLSLLDYLQGITAAIIVDAVQSSDEPGSVYRLGPDDLLSFSQEAGFAHGWGAAETLHLGRTLDPQLALVHVTLIGIVGKDFSLGAGLSDHVCAALGKAAEMVETEVQYILEKFAPVVPYTP